MLVKDLISKLSGCNQNDTVEVSIDVASTDPEERLFGPVIGVNEVRSEPMGEVTLLVEVNDH